jgi:hypothetical protein
MDKVKTPLITLHQWSLSHPRLVKPLHTFWQTFVGIFAAAALPILNTIPAIHSASDLKVAVVSLIAAALASALSAAKNSLWPMIVAWATSQANHISTP